MTHDQRKHLLLFEPNIYKTFFTLSFPVFIANLLTSLHDIVDAYFLGQIENSVYSQAAISITWPLLNVFLSFSMGLAVAGVSVISQNLGAGLEKEAKKYSGILFSSAILIGLAISLTLLAVSPVVMRLMGAEGEVYDCSLVYIRVRSLEIVFVFIFSAFQAIFQASGDTLTPFYISASTVGVNIALTAYFVRALNMGIFGAGLATFLAQAVFCPLILFLLFRKKAPLPITVSDMKIEKDKFKMLFKIGFPSAIGNSVSSFGLLIMNSMILSYGEVVMAAFSIGSKFSNMFILPMTALSSVQSAYTGQNIGAGNMERVRKGYKVGRNVTVGLAFTAAAIIMPFRGQLVSLMSNNADVVAVATEYMFYVLVFQPLLGMFKNYIGVFNGAGKTKYSMIVNLSRLWVIRIPLVFIFRAFTDLGRHGIWYSMVISNFAIVFVSAYFFRKMDFTSLVSRSSKDS